MNKTKEKPSLLSLFDKNIYTLSNVDKCIKQCKVNKLLLKANEHECLINIPHIADYLINQHGIIVDAKINDEKRYYQIKTFADLYAFPAYKYIKKREDLFLNTSAVRKKDGKAVLFCGVSSCGKSTMAWELYHRGADFIADEYVKVFFRDGKVYAKGYNPYFILSKKDLDLKKINADKSIYPNNNRYIVDVNNCYTEDCEIDTLIILNSFSEECMKVDVLNNEQKLKIFPSLIHMAELATTFIPAITLFPAIINIVDNLNIIKINYNKEADKLEKTVDNILSAVIKEKNE